MGLQDRDYYWEDRKRREQQFHRDTYYRPKEFRRSRGRNLPDDWNHPRLKRQWIIIGSFTLGVISTLLTTMIVMHVKPEILAWVYYATGKVLFSLGII